MAAKTQREYLATTYTKKRRRNSTPVAAPEFKDQVGQSGVKTFLGRSKCLLDINKKSGDRHLGKGLDSNLPLPQFFLIIVFFFKSIDATHFIYLKKKFNIIQFIYNWRLINFIHSFFRNSLMKTLRTNLIGDRDASSPSPDQNFNQY